MRSMLDTLRDPCVQMEASKIKFRPDQHDVEFLHIHRIKDRCLYRVAA